MSRSAPGTRPTSATVVRPSSAVSRRRNESADAADDSSHRPQTSFAVQHHASIVEMLRYKKQAHVDSYFAPTLEERSRLVAASSAAQSRPPTTAFRDPSSGGNAQTNDALLLHQWICDPFGTTTGNLSSAPLKTPSITQLMEESRRRKVGKMKTESLFLAELQYRERLQRSWLQQWWLLWCRAVDILLESAAKEAEIQAQLKRSVNVARRRRASTRRDVARGLAQLNATAHLNERFQNWKVAAIRLRALRRQKLNDTDPATASWNSFGASATSSKLPVTESDPHAGPSAEASPNISPIKPKKVGEALGDDHDEKPHDEATETSETTHVIPKGPSTSSDSHEVAAMQHETRAAAHLPGVAGDQPSAAQASPPSLTSTTPPRPQTPSYRGYKVEDAWSPSLGPPAPSSRPPSSSGPTEGETLTAARDGASSPEDLSYLAGTSRSRITNAGAALRLHFDEALVQFAVQDCANDLLSRHAAKLIKLAVKLESHFRSEMEASHREWNVLAGTQACFLVFQATAATQMIRFTRAAVEEMEHLVRARYACDESSTMVDLLVEFRVGLRELGHKDGVRARSSSIRPLAVVDDRRAALASAVRTTQRILRGFGQRQKLQRIHMFWNLERAIRNDAWSSFRQQLVLWSGQLARAIRETEDRRQQQEAAALVQRVGRGRQARRRLDMLASFWQADQAVRKEALVAFRSRVRRIALEEAECRLAVQERSQRSGILSQEHDDWTVVVVLLQQSEVPVNKCASDVLLSASSPCLLVQRIGRGFLARKMMRRHHEFWLVDAQVRQESFAAYLSRVRNIAARWEPRSNLAAVEATKRRVMTVEPEQAAFQNLQNLFVSAGNDVLAALNNNNNERRRVASVALLQRVGRGALRRALVTREVQFWHVDASIRAEAFTAWQREAKKLIDRFRRSLRVIRSEAAARATVVTEEMDERQETIENPAHAALASTPVQINEDNVVGVVSSRPAPDVIQRCGRGFLSRTQLRRLADFWDVDRLIRSDAYAAWNLQAASIARASHLELLLLEESLLRAQVQAAENFDWSTAWNSFQTTPRPAAAAVAAVELPTTVEAAIPIQVVVDEDHSQQQRSVSSESVRYASLTRDNQDSSVTTFEKNEGDDSEEVDVSSGDDDDAPPVKTAGDGARTVEDDDEEVDVSSDNEESAAPHPQSPALDTTTTTTAAAPNAPPPQAPPMSMFYKNHPSDDDDDSSSEVSVTSDDDDDEHDSPHGAVQGQLQGSLDRRSAPNIDSEENAARTAINDEMSVQWNALLRRARAEQSALSSDDDTDDEDAGSANAGARSDGEARVEIQLGGHSLEVEESGASPAKSDATHAPNGRGGGGRLSSSGRSMVSSGVTPVAPNSRSLAGSDAVEVETVTSDSSDTIHVDSSDSDVSVSSDDDDDDEDEDTPKQTRAPIGAPRTSTVRDLYMKMFAEQRESVASKESAVRQVIVHELDRLHQSLIAAEEYLIRHATVIYARNRFAKNMLDAKRKLADMVAMQHRRPSTSTPSRGPLSIMEPPQQQHHGRRGHTRNSSTDSVGSGPDLSPSFAIHQANTPYKRIFHESQRQEEQEGSSPSPQNISPPSQAPVEQVTTQEFTA